MVEQQTVENIVAGATPIQIGSMILLGAILSCALIAIVLYLIRLHINGLPESIKALESIVTELKIQLTELKGRLWTHEEIDNAIDVKIGKHVESYHKHEKPRKEV